MGFPAKLKNFNVFTDGTSHIGVATEVTPPKWAIKMEEWRGAGMLGPIMIDMGLDKLEVDFTLGGLTDSAFRAFGAVAYDATQLRFAGAYQDDSSGAVKAAEIVAMGRYQEIDFGRSKYHYYIQYVRDHYSYTIFDFEILSIYFHLKTIALNLQHI